MNGRRAFSAEGLPTKKTDYHGGARFARTMPDVAAKGIQSFNVHFDFEEALKLSVAIQACVLSLNKYNRSTTEGRGMGLSLSFKIDTKTVAVIETPVGGSRKQPKASR
jgi:hypothetical protein